MTVSIRLIGFLFLGLAFLAGITLGSLEIALVNVVVFLLLALLIVKVLEPRSGNTGLVYGMAGAFFVSVSWPTVLLVLHSGPECEDDDCEVTVTLEAVPRS